MDDLILAPNKHVVAALKDRRAAIACEIATLESRLRYLHRLLGHVDGSLKMFSPSFDPDSIPPKRRFRRVHIFRPGELTRLVLGTLRKAGKPLSVEEIIAAIADEMRFAPEARKSLRPRVRADIHYLHKTRGLVVKEGDRASAKWSLAPSR